MWICAEVVTRGDFGLLTAMSWSLLSVHQCCGGCNGGFGVGAAGLPGCARLELAQGGVPLNPQEAVFEGMLAGVGAAAAEPVPAGGGDDRAAGGAGAPAG
jgi:hypothetical protein